MAIVQWHKFFGGLRRLEALNRKLRINAQKHGRRMVAAITFDISPDSNGKPASERSECGLGMEGGNIGIVLQGFCASNHEQ
ncbi:hypothetical protein [Pedobacter nanyangensis]|uniref:hypothetical protein n=1 Tax=Pedobacter nanyangensis TaxID=1562389 RepID=UPI000DE4797D|nr:hypothetical protein [Pedobacter nanyangensis]